MTTFIARNDADKHAELRKNKDLFKNKVLSAVRKIPRGKTATYKEIARAAGSPHAYRAVGKILSKNYNPVVPCHRVIRSDGKLGGYNRGQVRKKILLEREKFRAGQ